jgi:hypothetical protein
LERTPHQCCLPLRTVMRIATFCLLLSAACAVIEPPGSARRLAKSSKPTTQAGQFGVTKPTSMMSWRLQQAHPAAPGQRSRRVRNISGFQQIRAHLHVRESKGRRQHACSCRAFSGAVGSAAGTRPQASSEKPSAESRVADACIGIVGIVHTECAALPGLVGIAEHQIAAVNSPAAIACLLRTHE